MDDVTAVTITKQERWYSLERSIIQWKITLEYIPHLLDGARTLNPLSDDRDLSLPACLFIHQTTIGLDILAPERKGLVLIRIPMDGTGG